MAKQKIAIGSDHGGYELKTYIERFLAKNNYEYKDFGCFDNKPADYPIIAKEVAKAVATGSFTKGIIVCGSGLGVCIAANKVSGIRAVTCTDAYCAKLSRMHNDANILTLGGRVVGTDLALDIIDTWLKTQFEGGRHQRRIDMIEK
ncbi:MAG: ribose 5-phosphate isomerase B [bacterium]